MRVYNTAIVTNGDMSASIESDQYSLDSMYLFSIQAVATGSPDGTLSLQASNDYGSNPPGTAEVVNWTDLADTSVPVTASGSWLWNIQSAGYKWVRLVYTRSSGDGVLNARIDGKGV